MLLSDRVESLIYKRKIAHKMLKTELYSVVCSDNILRLFNTQSCISNVDLV